MRAIHPTVSRRTSNNSRRSRRMPFFLCRLRVLIVLTGCFGCVGTVPAFAAFTAAVGSTVSSPQFVNLYWDDTWDVDNPSMPVTTLDSFMNAILSSSYFSGLKEYGVNSASYGGGFVPAAACPQKAPSSVGYYDPFNTSIIGFLQCEIDHGGVPTSGNVIYNVILPAGSLESDFFGTDTFCQGGPLSWHFHDTPYNPAIAAEIFFLSIFGAPPFLDVLVLETILGNIGPVYTITSASSPCGTLTDNLLHEMVEAITDPFPSLNVLLSGSGEIADQCTNSGTTSPFVPSGAVIPTQLSGGIATGPFTTASTISVPKYWSNANQVCVTGFGDTTSPNTPSVTVNSGQGPKLSMTVSGDGFGTVPAPFGVPESGSLPYVALQDQTQNWQAGNALNSDLFGLSITAWSNNTIKIAGIGNVGSDFNMLPTDAVSLWICNAASGNCSGGNITLPESTANPNLAIVLSVLDPQQYAPYVPVDIDGVAHGALFGDGNSTGWIPVSAGTHTVSATAYGTGEGFTVSYTGACNAQGKITLSAGQSRSCVVGVAANSLINMSGCPQGTHCCSPGNGHCMKGQCYSDKVICP